MSSKLIFLILSTLLLAQWSVCKPMPDDETTSDGEDISEKYGDEEKIQETMDSVLLLLVDVTKNVLEKVVADLNAIKDKSETLAGNMAEFKVIIEKLESIMHIDGHVEKIRAFEAVQKTMKTGSDEEQQILAELFRKATLEEQQQFKEKMHLECEKADELSKLVAPGTDHKGLNFLLHACHHQGF